MLAIKWQDKRDVHMLTTIDKDGCGLSKKKNFETGEIIKKPLAVLSYNANMGSDMQLSSAECVRKTIKWYKKVFFHLLDLTVLNCCIMYGMKTGKKQNLGQFRVSLIREIIERYGVSIGTGRRNASLPHPKRLV